MSRQRDQVSEGKSLCLRKIEQEPRAAGAKWAGEWKIVQDLQL